MHSFVYHRYGVAPAGLNDNVSNASTACLPLRALALCCSRIQHYMRAE